MVTKQLQSDSSTADQRPPGKSPHEPSAHEPSAHEQSAHEQSAHGQSDDREKIFDAFRRWGYLQSHLDPLDQYLPPATVEQLTIDERFKEGDRFFKEAREIYCGTVGAEFMHIADAAKRSWIQQRMEAPAASGGRFDTKEKAGILERLIEVDIFEQVIQARYPGTKRFSLEGVTVLIPFLDEVLDSSAERGAVQAVLGMSHRGRLSVMVNTIGRLPGDVFLKFEDENPRSILGGGDVKYHVGATGSFAARNGNSIGLHLVSNPSHLEAVDPVAMGRARAKQARMGADGERKVLPVLIHGDAAFAGQGIWAETLLLAGLPGYTVGGTIQIIVNNLIGFTAEPEEANPTRFCSDIAKRLDLPIFHVNAEDPEAALRVAALAVEYRYTFRSDVIVDLIGYRRHGHSEVDDPTITQPLRYAKIKNHPPLYQIYAKQIGVDPTALAAEVQSRLSGAQKDAKRTGGRSKLAELPAYWSAFRGGPYRPEYEVDTGLSEERIRSLSEGLTRFPAGFHIHPKIKKLLEQRAEMGLGRRPIDYGMAEALAFGSLLTQGTPVRFSGQDSRRGTFNQRHSVLIDIEDESTYIPLANLAPDQAHFEIYNSPLSEAGVMGFEYGYSRDFPEALTLWEAQFGDFANGAQIIIDQFISSAEDKWGLLSGLVLLLPHGYEGQGPEHSSARVERYLQLAAHDNIQICQPSNAAQYFHLLRRQAMRSWRKPLVVFTPKSMLRHPEASSPRESFSAPRFQPVLPETEITSVRRLLLCTGKIGHELRAVRAKHASSAVGIVSLEQLHPWPEKELAAEIANHPQAREMVWIQEEPANMGALSYVMPRLRRLAQEQSVLSVKRSAAASPATGSAKAHELEQRTLIRLALGEDAS